MAGMKEDKPIQIADHLYWVGHHLTDDRFQCHAYLLEHGESSVLFDPGSVLTFPQTLRKIEKITPFTNIRYFICQHQDPDITGAMPLIDRMNARDDAVLVTHWRTIVLLRHLGLKMKFWDVSEHNWSLDLGGRMLEFVFTPYLHFPGAITTFDRQTGTLLSSDLFGGFTEGCGLFAEDMSVFEGIRAFHEHYMPSHEILLNGMLRLEQLPLEMIAPQHGSILRKPLIQPIIDKLKALDCGLYLMTQRDSRVERLMQLSGTLRAMLRTLHLERELRTIASELLRHIQQVFPAQTLEFLVREGDGFSILKPENRYRGKTIEPGSRLKEAFGLTRDELSLRYGNLIRLSADSLALPTFSSDSGRTEGFAIVSIPEAFEIDEEIEQILTRVSEPLGVALEREDLLRQMERERDAISAIASRDPLTELFTRRYMNEVVTRLVALHDREERASFVVLILDIDHFKGVNDNYGHPVGDAILKSVAETVRNTVRASDVAVRFGGEEVVVIADVPSQEEGVVLAERVRSRVELKQHPIPNGNLTITVSIGVALRRQNEPFNDCLARADAALYCAKHSGRNNVKEAS
jgi:diguanylate cyclase (GGDEF)-like protein